MVCRYCGDEVKRYGKNDYKLMCGRCANKSSLLPKFVEARDNLRERLGLKRMWEKK
jgi:hypothetical protein